MSTASHAAIPPRDLPRGLGWLGDLGGIAILALLASSTPLRRRGDAPSLIGAIGRQVAWMIGMSLTLVLLISLSFGAFLAMQSYFGATFTEAAGPVVALGLIRNMGPMIAGFVLTGIMAGKITSELRGGPRPGLDDEPLSVPDRDASQGLRSDDRYVADAGRLTFTRVVAAMIAGPVLSTLGSGLGSLAGLLVSKSMMGLAPSIFLGTFVDMLMPCDVAGIVVKGAGFCGFGALISCFEGLRGAGDGEPNPLRAAVRSVVMILLINYAWFSLVYLAGSPFGPVLAKTPAG